MKPRSHPGKEHGSTLFGERLKQERMRRGFGVRMFADMAGFDVGQLTSYENRGVYPSFHKLVAIARVLECSMDYLAGLED